MIRHICKHRVIHVRDDAWKKVVRMCKRTRVLIALAGGTQRGPTHVPGALKLSEVQLYNMTGDHFGPRALGHRLLQPLFALTQLQPPKQHAFPSPADAIHLFGELRARLVAAHGTTDFPLEVAPFPVDLVPALQATPRTL